MGESLLTALTFGARRTSKFRAAERCIETGLLLAVSYRAFSDENMVKHFVRTTKPLFEDYVSMCWEYHRIAGSSGHYDEWHDNKVSSEIIDMKVKFNNICEVIMEGYK